MSQRLINRSPDLKRLQNEGYDMKEESGYLIIRNVPYLTSQRTVARAAIISRLELAGEQTTSKPTDHVIMFTGAAPCNLNGSEIEQIKHSTQNQKIGELTTQLSFSNKPPECYQDYHHKMTRYIEIISNPAKAVDPTVTAQTYPVIVSEETESPFHYTDTASSRADIVAVSKKLELPKIAIIGLGGTGSYVLDLVAKTPVKEIHLYDGDVFLQHNAFRAPGAPSIEELNAIPKKVAHFYKSYSKMHKGIIPHEYSLDVSNVSELVGLNFVFICIDGGTRKKHIIDKLVEFNIPFVDTGMGINLVDEALFGTIRLTTSTTQKNDHLSTKIGFSDDENNEYSRNIQVADLNALNAALAVIKWKKICGFYVDNNREHHCLYDTDGNFIHNTDSL